MTAYESDATLKAEQDFAISLTHENNVSFLNQHPRYMPALWVFSKGIEQTPSAIQTIQDFHADNAATAERIKDRPERIRIALGLASGIDILYGNIPLGGQYFGRELDNHAD